MTLPNPLEPALPVPADPNALEPAIWPATAARDPGGRLVVGGVPADQLAGRFGTPLYVLDEQDVRDRAATAVRVLTEATAAHGTMGVVYYAGKAFLSTEVARWMRAAGCRIDVCTAGELAVALAAGVPAAELGFHGNNKSDAELDTAVAVGLGTIVLDSEREVERVADVARRHGVVQAVRLRVNSGVHASTHEYLATAREDQKFGVPLTQVPAVVARIRALPSLAFRGLHSHIGSQIFDGAGFTEAAARLLAVHRDLLADGPVPELNLGGGFGIAYTATDDARPLPELVRGLVDAVARTCGELGIPVPALAIEPGRALVGPAGVTLYRGGTVKDVEVAVESGGSAVRRYVSVDGGMSDNLRPALYGADYTIRLAGRASTADPVLVRVAGKHCESGDIVVRADYLPADAGEGDLLAVAATGAYCHSLASNYNLLGRPPVVAVLDGEARVLVHRETIDDLLRRDAGVPVGRSTVPA